MTELLVRCSRCQKTHAASPGETPCAPGAWTDDETGFSWENAEQLRSEGFTFRAVVSIPTRSALADIAAERQRQIIEEGYTLAHDDGHTNGEIAQAAACFALPHVDGDGDRMPRLMLWPWPYTPSMIRQHNPANRRDELVRAGALIVAELERLDRLAATTT